MAHDETGQNPKQQVNAALERAKTGDFSGLPAVVTALTHEDDGVRIRAAYVCQRIGPTIAVEPLSHMARRDPVSDNRNQAIYALASIGRPAVVPVLIAALADEDAARRDDVRTALYQVLGTELLSVVSDDENGGERDEDEVARVSGWWEAQSAQFDATRVYAFGQLAGPAIFISQLGAATSPLPDAYLDALRDWTGQEFGQTPLSKVKRQWEKWWATNRDQFEAGRRYFFGRVVPSL